MQIAQIAEFLETDQLSFTFTSRRLRYLSLRENDGEERVNLRSLRNGRQAPAVALLLKETAGFLQIGKHNMPLDLTSFTEFQQAVFDLVLKIEPGDIVTYSQLATALGKPKAARAVGFAISKNPVSYFIPSHRVLPQRGIGRCISGAGFLRKKLLIHEGHDLETLVRSR